MAAPCLTAFADDEAPAEEAPQVDEALEAEIRYVEALIEFGYPDFADPVIAATKKKWPESEARFFAIEIRGLLSLDRFDEAEKRIAALPDRTGAKFWAARLEMANNLFYRGKKAECSKIYDEFFKAFPTPPKDFVTFYMQACYSWGQILVGDNRYAEAAKVYESLLKLISKRSEEEIDTWCNIASETAEMYIRLASDKATPAERKDLLKSAKKLVDSLLWEQDRPVYFGRAIAMKAHVELLGGNVARAQATIDEYMEQLAQIHQQIKDFDPDGKLGLLRLSPMPQCRYMLAEMLWKEAQDEYAKPKRDDERVKSLLFGEKLKSGKRNNAGAYNHALNVFIQYPECSWAAKSGEMADRIEDFASQNYNAKIEKKVTPEQLAKIRQQQFGRARELMGDGKYEEAKGAFYEVLGAYPECPESIPAIESLVGCYRNLLLQLKADAPGYDDLRLECDAVEGYLAERFAGNPDRRLMSAAGDAVCRVAAAEKQMGQLARADGLYRAFFLNYRNHANAANTAAAVAAEAQKAERYADALATWRTIGENFTNATYYALSFAQASACQTKLGDRRGAIASMKRYVELESNAVLRDQAQMALANMYKDDGLDILQAAATNETEEAVARQLKLGSAQIVRSIQQFKDFAARADKALGDPSVNKTDKERYGRLREGAMFLVGDCWRRMTKPEEKLATFRARAAESFEEYVAAYPRGEYARTAYVYLGTIYTVLEEVEKSKTALDRLSKEFPDSDEAKNAKPRLAKALMEMGFKDEATQIYGEMLRTDGAYTAGQFLLAGEALSEARSWAMANQAFEKAIAKTAGLSNQTYTVSRARLGEARALFRQNALAEAREALDLFLGDEKLAKTALAVDANFLMVEVASAQGAKQRDETARKKDFSAAIGAIGKVRRAWQKMLEAGKKEQWEIDSLALTSADISVRKLTAETAMGLDEAAADTRGIVAANLQGFLQSHGVDADHPADKMSAGELGNLERCYVTLIPLLAKMGKGQADQVLRRGREYMELFPNGKDRTLVQNCLNQAKADLGNKALPASEPASAAAESAAPEEPAEGGQPAAAEAAAADAGEQPKESTEEE